MLYFQRENSTKAYNIDLRIYEDFGFFPHLHKDLEFVHVLEGELEINVDGEETFIFPGESALITGGQAHAFRTPAGRRSKTFVAVFASDYVRDFSVGKDKVCVKNSFRMPEADLLFLKEKFIGKREVPDRLTLTACLNLICADFLKTAVFTEKRTERNGGVGRMQEILCYVTEHYKEDITLGGTAKALGYEEHYLSRIFHADFKMNFKQFVNTYRVAYAEELLSSRENAPAITEVAYLCGFQSVRNFNRAYKEITGRAPREKNKTF